MHGKFALLLDCHPLISFKLLVDYRSTLQGTITTTFFSSTIRCMNHNNTTWILTTHPLHSSIGHLPRYILPLILLPHLALSRRTINLRQNTVEDAYYVPLAATAVALAVAEVLAVFIVQARIRTEDSSSFSLIAGSSFSICVMWDLSERVWQCCSRTMLLLSWLVADLFLAVY